MVFQIVEEPTKSSVLRVNALICLNVIPVQQTRARIKPCTVGESTICCGLR